MLPQFRSTRPIIWLLILTLGHVPVPWAHRHDCLAEEQLEAHLARFHAGANCDVLPAWHVHVSCLGSRRIKSYDGVTEASSSSDSIVSYDDQPLSLEDVSRGSQRRLRIGQVQRLLGYAYVMCVVSVSIASSAGVKLRNPYLPRNDGGLYDLYCSLLI